MTKKILVAIVFLITGLILLVINLYNLDFDNLKEGKYAGIISNIVLMSAMIISLQHKRKKG